MGMLKWLVDELLFILNQEISQDSSLVYLPLPVLTDISLSICSLLLQLNVMLSSSSSPPPPPPIPPPLCPGLKCFNSPFCLLWHECAPERSTVQHAAGKR